MPDPYQIVEDNKPDPVVKTESSLDRLVNDNLRLAHENKMDPKYEGAVYRKSKEIGVSPALLRGMDANEPGRAPIGLQDLSPVTAKFLGAEVQNAAIFKNHINDLAAIERMRVAETQMLEDARKNYVEPATIGEAFSQGEDAVAYGKANYAKYFKGDNSQDAYIAQIQERMQKYAKASEKTSGLSWMLHSATEMLPIIGSGIKRGLPYAMAGGGAAAGAAAIAGQAGPQVATPEELLTVPGAFTAGATVGFSTGMTQDIFEIETGNAIAEYSTLQTVDGQPINPLAAKSMATMVGMVNAGLEVTGLKFLAKTLPTNWLKSKFGKSIIEKALSNPAVNDELAKIGARYATAVGVESATEMAQETAQIIGQFAATQLSETFAGQEFSEEDKAVFTAENFSRVLEAGQKAAAASLLLGAPGITLEVVADQGRRAKQEAFKEAQGRINDRIHASGMLDNSPEKMREFLQLTGNGGAVYIDSDMASELPSTIMGKLGVTPAQQEIAVNTGQDLRVSLETVHTALSREEFQLISPAMRPGFDATVDPKLLPEDIKAAVEIKETEAKREIEYKQELSRFTAELREAVEISPKLREQARAEGVTSDQYASSVAKIFDRFSRRLSMEGRELKETLQKLKIAAFPGKRYLGDGKLEFKQEVSQEAKDWLATLPEQDRAKLADSIKYLEANPDPKGDKGNLQMILDAVKKREEKQLKFKQGESDIVNAVYNAEQGLISIFDNANLSSVLHEGAHFFFDEMRQVIESGVASDAMKADWQKLVSWTGVDLSVEKDEAKIVMAQEAFARGFEEYLMEGKAPDAELTAVFDRFRNWLKRVYRGIVANLGSDRIALTDEVRGVFDRMLMADTQAKQAAESLSLNGLSDRSLNNLGLSKEEKEQITNLLEVAEKSLSDKIAKRRERGRRSMEKQWRDEAAKTILEEPVYQAMATIAKGGGLRQIVVIDQYGADTAGALRERGLLAAKNNDGLQPDVVAEKHGFNSADDLIIALLDAYPSRQAAVEAYVAQQGREYDAAFSADESLLDTTEYEQYMEMMNRYLSEALEKTDKADKKAKAARLKIKREAYRLLAEQQMMNVTMKDAMNINEHLATMRKVMKRERRALLAGNFEEALVANEQGRLAFERAKLAKEAKQMADKAIRLGNKAARTERGTIEEQHHLNIINLIQRFGMLQGTKEYDLSRREKLSSLFDPSDPMMDVSGLFGPQFFDETWAVSFKELPLAQFKQLDSLIKFINGRGRALIKDELRAIGQSREMLQGKILENMTAQKSKPPVVEGSWFAKGRQRVREYFSWTDQFRSVLKQMDNYSNVGAKGEMGPAESFIWQSLSRAYSDRILLSDKIKIAAKPHLDQLLASMVSHGKILARPPIPETEAMKKAGQRWTYERVICAALNMGNEYNRNALIDGMGITEADLANLTSILSAEDWKAVQGIWDTIDSLWPQISEVFYRMNHFHQDKVQAKAFSPLPGVELRGGYYPIKFDPDLSREVAAQSERENLMDANGALFPVAAARNGFTKQREGTGGKPLKLSLGVLGSHLEHTIQYITHAEIVQDVDRLLTRKSNGKQNPLLEELTRTQGVDVANMIRPTLAYIARPEGEILDTISSIFEKSRALSTAYLLGLNLRVASLQVIGTTTIVNDLGATNYAKGALQVAMHPYDSFMKMRELSPYMSRRAQLLERDIAHSLKAFSLDEKSFKGVTLSMVRSTAFTFIWVADLMVTLPAWFGAYGKAMKANGGDHQAAIVAADELIAATNPSARPMDLAAFQRSNKGMHRMFTMFSTFTMLYGNRLGTHYRAWKSGKLSSQDYLRHVMLEALLPPILTGTGMTLLWGESPDEDDLKKQGLAIFLYQVQGMPFARDVIAMLATQAVNATIEDREKRAWNPDPTKTPIFAGLDLTRRFGASMSEFATDLDDDEKMVKAVNAFMDMAAFRIGVPLPKATRNVIEGMRQFEEGDGTAFNVFVPNPEKKEQ